LELVQIVDEVFGKFGINVCIKINNRKVLQGLAEVIGFPDKLIDITVAIDKIDKIGLDAVKAELLERGIDEKGIATIEPVLLLQGTTAEKLSTMREILASSEAGIKGVDELEELFGYINAAGISQEVEIDLSLARGLNYYTGAIFEVKAKDFAIGSICGGGRYDDLTGIFGLPNMSGVGISFGADRIYDVLMGLDKFPKDAIIGTQILFSNMGAAEVAYSLPIVAELRKQGYNCEIYPDNSKLKKQFDYATKKNIPYFAIVGGEEIEKNVVNIKNLETGEQKVYPKGEIKFA
jgi:histidyl-tRNA synthetase